jgi:hypothetical protein
MAVVLTAGSVAENTYFRAFPTRNAPQVVVGDHDCCIAATNQKRDQLYKWPINYFWDFY